MRTTRWSSEAPIPVEQSILAARSGSSSDLGNLLGLYQGYLLRLAAERLCGKVRSKFTPSDLVQETLLKVVRTFPDFRGSSDAEFRAWLREILHGTATDNLRRFMNQKRDISSEIQLSTDLEARLQPDAHGRRSRSASSCIRMIDRIAMVERALQSLPEDYRSVVRMHHFDGMDFGTISQHLGRTPEALQKVWMRAIRKLAQVLPADE